MIDEFAELTAALDLPSEVIVLLIGTGRGIKLMRSIMDEVRFNAAGNEVTLTKRRALETLEDCEAETEGG